MRVNVYARCSVEASRKNRRPELGYTAAMPTTRDFLSETTDASGIENGSPGSRAISVSELNRRARKLLEGGIARLWVEGEISNLARPASGHIYLSLKDDNAQIRCAWFRQRQQRGAGGNIANGDQVTAYGRVSLYEPRGDYQLIVERLEAAGEGKLRQQFEALKRKLDAEGLFAQSLKRPLPTLPRRIGVITSPSGAAVRDVLTVLNRRFASIPVTVYPASVQGDAAVTELVRALETAARRAECDVLIVGRGGGSLEDLQAFNDEALARTIRRSPIPVISAVGHEVDFSIADLVADVRAPTPSGAAEIAVPEQVEWLRAVQLARQRLITLMSRRLEDESQSVDWLARRLGNASPASTVARQAERLAALGRSLAGSVRHDLLSRRRHLDRLAGRLLRRSPESRLQAGEHRYERLAERLSRTMRAQIDRSANRLTLAARALDAVSPLATLERGFAVVTDAAGRIATDATRLSKGEEITARLASGQLRAAVTDIQDTDGESTN